MEIILATRNSSKIDQIKPFFTGSPFVIKSLADLEFRAELPEENGKTLHENALIKARFGQSHFKAAPWTIAEDTGLFIDALNGEPGIYAARWAGKNADSEAIMRYCLKRLENAPYRGATFKTVAALLSSHGEEKFFVGVVRGALLTVPRVPCQPGMPYSALFVPVGSKKTWAEMTVEEENKISHRGQAFRQVLAFLDEQVKNKIA